MISHVIDTDIFSLYTKGNASVLYRVSCIKYGELALSIITIDEVLSGWKAYINRAKTQQQTAWGYDRFSDSLQQISPWTIVSFSIDAVQLLDQLRKQKLNIGANDLKIAAIALTLNATVVTRNLRDFQRVPNLKIEDWTQP